MHIGSKNTVEWTLKRVKIGGQFMATTITWLHLSDLHAWKKRNWDANKVLKTLQADLKRMEEDYDLHPNLVFFTGDAAQGHMSEAEGDKLVDQYGEVKH